MNLKLQLATGGKLYSNQKWNSSWVNFIPDAKLLEFAEILRENDLLLLAEPSQDLLLKLNQVTRAQIGVVGKPPVLGLADFAVSEQDLHGALEEMGSIAILTQKCFRKALFLDRDGVVVENVDYNRFPEKVKLLKGAVELIRKAHAQGYLAIVVTNQSGIARQRLTWDEYHQVTFRMQELLAAQGCWLDAIYEAPFYPEGELVPFEAHRHFRKPRTGMIQKARYEFAIDLQQSLLVGDSYTDLLAGAVAGIPKNILYGAPAEWEKLQNWPLYSYFSETFLKASELNHIL